MPRRLERSDRLFAAAAVAAVAAAAAGKRLVAAAAAAASVAVSAAASAPDPLAAVTTLGPHVPESLHIFQRRDRGDEGDRPLRASRQQRARVPSDRGERHVRAPNACVHRPIVRARFSR